MVIPSWLKAGNPNHDELGRFTRGNGGEKVKEAIEHARGVGAKVMAGKANQRWIASHSEAAGGITLHNHAYWKNPEENAKKYFGHLSTDNPGHPLYHETGHFLHPNTSANWFGWNDKDIAGKVSQYARSNPQEFVAETYAGLVNGKKYPDDVMGMYKQYHGTLPQQKALLKAAAEPKFITYRGHVFPVGGDHVDVHSAEDLTRASKEGGGARVFNFSQGEGSVLDRNVKLTTNHGIAGTFERGKVRIDIRDENGGRHVFERPMSQLPSIVSTLLSKKYNALSQHRVKQDTVMKAGNPNHDEDGRFSSGGSISGIRDETHLKEVFGNLHAKFIGQSVRLIYNSKDKQYPYRAVSSNPDGGTNLVGYGKTKDEAANSLSEQISKTQFGQMMQRTLPATQKADSTGRHVHNEEEILQDKPSGGGAQQQSGGGATQFITLPGGKHIPLGGSQGGTGKQGGGQQQENPNPQSESDLPADVQAFQGGNAQQYQSNSNLSPEANRAKQDALSRQNDRKYMTDKMTHGPYYQNGQVRVPAYFYNKDRTPAAAATWKAHGFKYDGQAREWTKQVSLNQATQTVRNARAAFDKAWGISRGQKAMVSGWELLKAYNPDEARDKNGEWTSGGSASPAQRYATEPVTVAELTHEQMTQIAQKVAGRMGIDPKTIEVADKDEHDEGLGVKVGEHDPETGKITLYPASFAQGKEELIGTLAHEAAHEKFSRVASEYNRQHELYAQGESLLSGKLDLYKDLSPVFNQRQSEFANADGQTKYSSLIWQQYQRQPSARNYQVAVSETLAEVERLNQTGKGGDVHPLWKYFNTKVNNYARGLNA